MKRRARPEARAKVLKQQKQRKPTRAPKNPKNSPSPLDRLVETGGGVVPQLQSVRFAGVSLGGGKTDKTAVAILEYYPERKRIFLRSLREKVSAKAEVSADEALYDVLTKEETDLTTIAFDAPLDLPLCVRCELKCPGAENCNEPVLTWMRDVHSGRKKEKRPNKMFTPYTERAAEIYIANALEEPFHPSHALGANAAPLTARAHYLRRRLKTPLIEAYPKLTLWRIGQALDMPKSYLRFHRHAVDSDEARLFILKTLIEKDIAFIYQQDMRVMVENNIAFEAFLCAITAFLKYRGQTESPPASFPRNEAWIDFPVKKVSWF
ncbi:MAG: DUF429 domain-containing protein [Bdellovibrionota bacterium]